MYLAFDIDGTVYDVADIAVPCFEEGITLYIRQSASCRLKVPSREAIVNTLGLPMNEIFLKLFPALADRERHQLMENCTGSLVSGIRRGGGYIFDDVAPTLDLLCSWGHKCLVASNGRLEYVMAILETWDLLKYFSLPMVFPGEGIPDKTALVRRYMEIIGSGETLVMIGDRYTDRNAAEANGIPFIGCAFGHAGNQELEGADFIVRSFSGIPEAVRMVGERCHPTGVSI